MSTNRFISDRLNRQAQSEARRCFLKRIGLGLAGGALALSGVRYAASAAVTPSLPEHPNILLLITDQERSPQHWPDDFDSETLLPGRWRLAQNGLTFRRNYCNSAMCSPSRASLFTGLYPAQHHLARTLTYNGALSDSEVPLASSVQNMAHMLKRAGYRVALKGKWHVSKHEDGGPPDADDVAKFGFMEWEPTEAGEATDVDLFGAGCADNDNLIAAQALEFLRSDAAHADQPFALVVSLVNPHDVLSYPRTYDKEGEGGCSNYAHASYDMGFTQLPNTWDEDLSTKPDVQAAYLPVLAAALGAVTDPNKLDYFNFYAYLHTLVDRQIVDLLDELDAQGLTESTVIVRVADHGEMGMSHGGMRQKMFNAYEETLRVPLVISNPLLFPGPVETDALSSLVDVLPTLASLAHVAHPGCYFAGKDLTPIIDDARLNPASPGVSVQDAVLFTFDDDRSGTPNQTPPGIAALPHHVRCLVVDDADGSWKIVRYFNPEGETSVAEQYELYHLRNVDGSPDDADEANNLAGAAQWQTKFNALLARLLAEEAARLTPVPGPFIPLIIA